MDLLVWLQSPVLLPLLGEQLNSICLQIVLKDHASMMSKLHFFSLQSESRRMWMGVGKFLKCRIINLKLGMGWVDLSLLQALFLFTFILSVHLPSHWRLLQKCMTLNCISVVVGREVVDTRHGKIHSKKSWDLFVSYMVLCKNWKQLPKNSFSFY